MYRTRKLLTPQEIEDLQERMEAMEELDFRERREVRKNRTGEHRPRLAATPA
ncbi:hypothetical protein SAMN05216577_1607 [Pseudomonas citronellolis]|uniref:Uncharacterized protein n=1 Tax=Pseudomonas citronellolis TaxID=53408 RepID=A0AAQ1KPZ4_9PSED|nr:hypothetical protein [Pseudomonas citronellolis]MCP1607075.1 hypothetical protein [Pseudomonas citronellolis]MCP1657830.1 hypothetical protein [Pseudomonas citronellolis]MCP1724800.1 hypothetical protein [Pseudomonas citronellolis]MDN6874229.1 hypothetical protein [Pseudomonas citronellolis]UXJ54943.1 hypothetical protein N5P21_12315 [Pseudomonas citronellolis]